MTRQLHPEIFQTQSEQLGSLSKNDKTNMLSPQSAPIAKPQAYESPLLTAQTISAPQAVAAIDNVDLQIFSMKINTLQKQIKDLEAQIGFNSGRIDEVTKASKLKFDSLQKANKQTEAHTVVRHQSQQAHLAELSGKVTSQRLRDTKIEELINRQNQMVQTFEARMNDVKKVVSEQQYQIMNLKGALKEALRRLHK
jgi:chromosome segregation ATPase